MTTIALFDLDETLIHGDTPSAWNLFAVQNHMINDNTYQEKGEALYQDYLDGCLNIKRYMEHCLQSIKGHTPEEIAPLVTQFIKENVKPRVYQEAWETLKYHKKQGHHLLLISASSSHIVAPIATMLGMDTCISTDPEIKDRRYTGTMTGIPSFQSGKVTRFKAWLNQANINVKETWFYSDSLNDIPLLEYADNPVVTNPVPQLEAVAKEKNWPVIKWNKPEVPAI